MAKNTKTTEKPAAAPKKGNGKAAKVEEKKVSTAWNVGQTMTLHGCRVGKKEYRSVWAAFLGEFGKDSADCKRNGRHIKFRKALKDAAAKAKKMPYTMEYTTVAGKKVPMTLIESSNA